MENPVINGVMAAILGLGMIMLVVSITRKLIWLGVLAAIITMMIAAFQNDDLRGMIGLAEAAEQARRQVLAAWPATMDGDR